MSRTTPGLLRLTVLAGLTAFWLAAVLVVAVLLSWPAPVLAMLAALGAAALGTTLILARQAWIRMRASRVRRERVAPGSQLREAA